MGVAVALAMIRRLADGRAVELEPLRSNLAELLRAVPGDAPKRRRYREAVERLLALIDANAIDEETRQAAEACLGPVPLPPASATNGRGYRFEPSSIANRAFEVMRHVMDELFALRSVEFAAALSLDGHLLAAAGDPGPPGQLSLEDSAYDALGSPDAPNRVERARVRGGDHEMWFEPVRPAIVLLVVTVAAPTEAEVRSAIEVAVMRLAEIQDQLAAPADDLDDLRH